MFQIDKKNFKKGNKLAFLFIIGGLLLTLVTGWIEISYVNKKNSLDKQVESFQVDENGDYDDEGNYMYTPTFHYEVNGKQYACESKASYSKAPSPNTTIYYSSEDPKECLSQYELSSNWIIIAGIILSTLTLGIGIYLFIKNKKVIKKVNTLLTNGKLIKGLPYALEGTNTYVNGHQVQKIGVYYETPNGLTLHLVGNPRYDLKSQDEDGLVDLLIDPNDNNNYFIDFDIKFKEGAQVEYYNSGNINTIMQTEIPQQQEQYSAYQEAVPQQVTNNNQMQTQQNNKFLIQPIQTNTYTQQTNQQPEEVNSNDTKVEELLFKTPVENTKCNTDINN